jgi:hypothetical protein
MNPACESTYQFVWFVSANLRFVVVKFFLAFFYMRSPCLSPAPGYHAFGWSWGFFICTEKFEMRYKRKATQIMGGLLLDFSVWRLGTAHGRQEI